MNDISRIAATRRAYWNAREAEDTVRDRVTPTDLRPGPRRHCPPDVAAPEDRFLLAQAQEKVRECWAAYQAAMHAPH